MKVTERYKGKNNPEKHNLTIPFSMYSSMCTFFTFSHTHTFFYYLRRLHKVDNQEGTKCGQVISTPASYSGVPGFKSQLADQLPGLSFIMVCLTLSRKMLVYYPKHIMTASFHILSSSSFTDHPII
jgi:hypothetical protein